MTDGLKDAHREAIIAAIAANDRVERAVLFGSRATGTNTVSSDVDIALFGDGLTLTDHARLAAALDEIPMAQSIDLLLYDSIQDRTLREHIRSDGVEWFVRPASRLRGDWTQRRLVELCDITRGASPRPIHDWTAASGVPWVKIADASATPSRCIEQTREYIRPAGRDKSVPVFPGDLILSNSATPGIPKFMGIEACIHDGWLLLRNFRGLDRLFAYYLLLHEREAIVGKGTGSVFTNLKTDTLKRHGVRVPRPDEQRAIAHILGTLDDKIELNRRMNATLEAMARALFRSWFVDFDPVRAKMVGRDTRLPQEIADLFPGRLVDSELGEIPKGWRASTLAEVARLNPESWSNQNAPARILYVDLAKTKWGDIDEIQMLSWADAPSRARRVLRRGDTIVGTVRPGNGSFALIDRDDLTGSTGFAVLRPTDPIEREIVWCAATSADAIDRLAHLADGGAYPAVSPKAVLDIAVALPDERIRLAFSSVAAPLLNRLKANQREARILGTLRDTLLPKIVSGELRVNGLEPASAGVDSSALAETHGA